MNNVIPEAAVEEAARAALGRYLNKATIQLMLEAAAPIMRQAFYLEMRLRAVEDELRTPNIPEAALEAAAVHMSTDLEPRLADWERCPKRHAGEVQHFLDCEP